MTKCFTINGKVHHIKTIAQLQRLTKDDLSEYHDLAELIKYLDYHITKIDNIHYARYVVESCLTLNNKEPKYTVIGEYDNEAEAIAAYESTLTTKPSEASSFALGNRYINKYSVSLEYTDYDEIHEAKASATVIVNNEWCDEPVFIVYNDEGEAEYTFDSQLQMEIDCGGIISPKDYHYAKFKKVYAPDYQSYELALDYEYKPN